MATVAEKAGVSITTVSHVINKTRHVNPGTKEAVLSAIKALDYRFPKLDSFSKDGRHICVGVVLADAREDFYIEMLKSIESVAADYGAGTVFCDSEASFFKETRNLALLSARRVDGILLAPADADRMPDALRSLSIPVVLLDRQYAEHNFLAVGINNFRSSYDGAKRLFDRGCRRIAFIGYSDPVDTIRARIRGCCAAVMELCGAGEPAVLRLKYNGGDSYPLIADFLRAGRFDGILCATSGLCYELIDALGSLEEDIKRGLNIVCFDDNRWFDYLNYPVSVIAQPVAEIGNAAFDNLLRMIKTPGNNRAGVRRELVFETAFIERFPATNPAL